MRISPTYRPILSSFKTFCAKTYIDEIERSDLLDFATHCMKQSQKGKSIYNKLVVLSQVLKQHGRSKLLNASDWPSFVETLRPIYEDAELEKLFAHCTPAEEMRFKFYLMSGFRDAEGRFVTWRDVDFRHSAVRVTTKISLRVPSQELGGTRSPSVRASMTFGGRRITASSPGETCGFNCDGGIARRAG